MFMIWIREGYKNYDRCRWYFSIFLAYYVRVFMTDAFRTLGVCNILYERDQGSLLVCWESWVWTSIKKRYLSHRPKYNQSSKPYTFEHKKTHPIIWRFSESSKLSKTWFNIIWRTLIHYLTSIIQIKIYPKNKNGLFDLLDYFSILISFLNWSILSLGT